MDCVVRATGDEFIRTLGVVLTKIVSDVAPEYGPISCFNSMNAPPISDYLTRIARYVNCSNECFVLALVYIDRIMRLHRFSVSVLNIHRLLITSVMLAAKFSDDVYYSNSFYAQVGGIKVSEMNQLEAQFLILIKYHLFVNAHDYENCRKGVESSSTKIYTLSNGCTNNYTGANQCRNSHMHKGVVHTGGMPSSNYAFNNKYATKNVNSSNLLIKGKDIKRFYKPTKCQVVKMNNDYVANNMGVSELNNLNNINMNTGINSNININNANINGINNNINTISTNINTSVSNINNINSDININSVINKSLNSGYLYNDYAPTKSYNYPENSYVDTTYMDGYLVYQYGMDYPYARTESSITVSTAASFDHTEQMSHHTESKLNKLNNVSGGRLDNKLDECEAFVNALENRYKDTLKRKCSTVQQFALVKNHW